MKARVKATGEIKEVSRGIYSPYQYVDKEGRIYTEDQLEEMSEGGGVITIDDTPDYWTRLEHQYAGMAMAGICANPSYDEYSYATMADDAIGAAHALILKLKEKEERK